MKQTDKGWKINKEVSLAKAHTCGINAPEISKKSFHACHGELARRVSWDPDDSPLGLGEMGEAKIEQTRNFLKCAGVQDNDVKECLLLNAVNR